MRFAKAQYLIIFSILRKEGKWLDDLKNEQKIDNSYEEFGNPPPDSKGKRSDLSELYRMIQDNMTNSEIIQTNQDYILQIDKLDKLRNTILIDKYKDTVRLDLEVIYIVVQQERERLDM